MRFAAVLAVFVPAVLGFGNIPADKLLSDRILAASTTLARISEAYKYTWGDELNISAWREQLELESEVWVAVAGGVGNYSTLKSATEYLAIASSAVNHNWWDPSTSTSYSFSMPSPNVLTPTQEISVETFFFNGRLPVPLGQNVNVVFAESSDAVRGIIVPGDDNLRMIVQVYVLSAGFTRYQGDHDLCMMHELYCTGDAKQWESYDACMSNMTTVPLISDTCGTRAPMAGKSRSCYFKHKFMIPFDTTHCFHINSANGKCIDIDTTENDVLYKGECSKISDGMPVFVPEGGGLPDGAFNEASRAYDDEVDAMLQGLTVGTPDYNERYKEKILGYTSRTGWGVSLSTPRSPPPSPASPPDAETCWTQAGIDAVVAALPYRELPIWPDGAAELFDSAPTLIPGSAISPADKNVVQAIHDRSPVPFEFEQPC